MFEPAQMNQFRPNRGPFSGNRHPFMLNHHQQAPRLLPMRFSGSLPTSVQHSSKLQKGISGFSNALNHLQQVLRVVETTTPIVKEYGPMIKNLPAMYRMVKAFKEINEIDEEGVDTTSIEEKPVLSENPEKEMDIKRERTGISQPKLYI